jgi:hypothetical protein
MVDWKLLHDAWEADGGDLFHEPIEPAEPPERPLPFSVEVKGCYKEDVGWLPFQLHKAILRLLHRRNFFKRTEEIEVVQGTLEPTLENEPGTIGSATT